MDAWAGALLGMSLIVGMGGALWLLVVMARRIRRRGGAGQAIAAAMAAYDEGFHSTANDAFIEMRASDERGQRVVDRSPRRP